MSRMRDRKGDQMIEKIERYRELTGKIEELTIEKRDIAKELATLLPAPTEGSKTHNTDHYKVTVKNSVNRKVDWPAFDDICMAHGLKHSPCKVKEKRELDMNGIRFFQTSSEHKDIFADLSETITATPGQPQVTIKVKE